MPRKSTGRRLYGCGILHTKRFKKEIDLALLGIEKWADDRAYFCTPRKAGIIGRDGVPGALCRHELYRYAGTAGRRYDPCGLRRRLDGVWWSISISSIAKGIVVFTWFVVILRRYTHLQAQGVDGLE